MGLPRLQNRPSRTASPSDRRSACATPPIQREIRGWIRAGVLALLVALAGGGAVARRAEAAPQPATGNSGPGVVAAEHPRAVEAGLEILAAGGSAADAAIATALATCVLHASSCGIGGGGFLIGWVAREGRALALDYRETAPRRANPDLFNVDGVYQPDRSRRGGLAVGVPGEIAGLWAVHRRLGRLPWARLFAPAIRIAQDGFALDGHMARQVEQVAPALATEPALAAAFLADGKPPAAGAPVRLPELAATLTRIAAEGPDGFYRGPVAEAIVARVARAGGVLDASDLRDYRPVWREPLHTPYRGAEVYTMPLPSSGGPALILALRTLSRFDVAALGADTPTRWHLFAEIWQHAFAERTRHAGDPAFGARAPTTDPAHVMRGFAASRTFPAEHYGVAQTGAPDAGTAHISVIAPDGDAVACTTTINTTFGALLVADGTGVVLNNEIDDFTFDTSNSFGLGPGPANRLGPGRRPASSMTPTVAVRRGRGVVAVGGSGGPMIATATLTVLSNVLDFGMAPEAAVAQPRVHHQWQPRQLMVEPGISPVDRAALSRLGHEVLEVKRIGAVSLATAADDGAWADGAGDPRKEGAAGQTVVEKSRWTARPPSSP